ncbi:hypothetical protein MAMC_02051 [Methylacidimicrobium cyclopophantes]|uniref:Secretin/TonB short N-terminal domain-containing protein n=1 Tax=Methylacidimicrobium cyclopophantes TaxID=1041766 RepID=A0A5E6MFP9_9BACT|nr:hypothetical protein [Methylacidimicrobium cyclopophantes]VVM08315.1 hypothetical protein MAMC_02051 [Methylacidimicrobium cyclopophantes]
MKALRFCPLWAGILVLFVVFPSSGQEREAQPHKGPAASFQQFDIDFRPGRSLLSAPSVETPLARPDEAAAKAYHILGMPLNAFLQAMAQRAGANYIATPDVRGMVNSIFYDIDPISMAKAGARANGYALESLDGIFVVHRLPVGELSALPGEFRQKITPRDPAISPPASSQSGTEAASAPREKSSRLRPVRPQSTAAQTHPPASPKKLPIARLPPRSPEEKKLMALTKKLARQKEEQKRLLKEEQELHRRLREEERMLLVQRKATEKALREELARYRKAAEEARRLQAAE